MKPSMRVIRIRHSIINAASVAAILTAAAIMPILAEAAGSDSEPVKLDKVEVNASAIQQSDALVPVIVSAQTVEPASLLGRNFIEKAVAPTVDYSQIINFTPSVAVVSPGLPGSQESTSISIRGFQDGQYNVTFDGIPFGDTNDFSHHSNDYFTAIMLDSVSVDRGPGSPSTVGEATFGGSIAMNSRMLSDTGGLELSETLGSYRTRQSEISLQTGRMGSFGDARAYLALDHEDNDGWATMTGLKRTDIFFKFDRNLGSNTTVTAALTYTDSFYYTNAGATAAQIAQFGPRFGLNNDPTSQANYAWNYQPKKTDMEYVDLRGTAGALRFDDKAYSYYYQNITRTGLDLSGETPNGTVLGAALLGPKNNDVPGLLQPYNEYRAFGNILKLEADVPGGVAKAGIWTEYQRNFRYGYNLDFTLGGAYDELPGTNSALNYYMHNSIKTFQPYLEYDWKPLPGLTVSPGVKYVSFRRDMTALSNMGTGAPLNFGKLYTATTPSISINDQVTKDVTIYAQAAKGFLAPNLNLFYVSAPQSSSVSPQETTNYQTGIGYSHNGVSLSLDAYYIDFNNLIGKRTIGQNTIFFNQGGVTYRGLEAEASVVLGSGLSLYANGSLNKSADKATGLAIPESARRTVAAGLLYSTHGLDASIIAKYIGARFGDTGETIPIGGYTIATASVGYAIPTPFAGINQVKLRLTVDNLFNRQGIDDLFGYTPINNLPIYWTIPGRSYYLTATINL